jgi:hypothetical protein
VTIDPASAAASLLAAIEAQSARKGAKSEKPTRPGRAGAGGSSRRNLADELARVAEAYDPESPASYERARRQAVSVLLQDQLGSESRELPEWSGLVDRVVGAISSDNAIDRRMAAWLRSLKR